MVGPASKRFLSVREGDFYDYQVWFQLYPDFRQSLPVGISGVEKVPSNRRLYVVSHRPFGVNHWRWSNPGEIGVDTAIQYMIAGRFQRISSGVNVEVMAPASMTSSWSTMRLERRVSVVSVWWQPRI